MAFTITAQEPAIVGWLADLSANISQPMIATTGSADAFLTSFVQCIESNPILRYALLVLLLIVSLTVCSLAIFLLLFVFNFKGVSQWFNRKAGSRITPQNRFDKLLWRFVPFFATIVIGAVLISEVGGPVAAAIAVALPILCWLYMVHQRAAFWGSRRIARWEMVYIVYAGFAVFMGVMLLWWALLYYLVFKLAKTFVTAPSRYTCGECDYYDEGYCDCHCERVSDRQSSCPDFR